MRVDLVASYRASEAVARARARNFYYSFLVLPPPKRRALCAVYAFMRYCDDISDGDAAAADKKSLLARWRGQLDSALQDGGAPNPIIPAFRDTLTRFSIPPEYFHWIIDGAEMDLANRQYERFEDLYRYCFNVASAVGLVCIRIFGYSDERAKEYAEQCGIAFQLTNILRDIREDAKMGRIYLPLEDLRKFRYRQEELLSGVMNERFRTLMDFEAARAGQYYERARHLLPLIEENSRPALWAMMEIYGRLLRKIVRARYDVFRGSVSLSAAEKASITLQAFLMRFFHAALPIR